MKKLFLFLAVAVLTTAGASSVSAQYGSSTMSKKEGKSSKTVADVAMASPDHTTLVAAVKAAGLADTLKSKGPFTVFAPTNAAFSALPAGTVDTLLKPENKSTLTNILTYHVVAGKWEAKDVLKLIKDNGGKATVKTVSGGNLTLMTDGKTVMITDEKGMTANVTAADLKGSNGVIHVVDSVLMPK
jgi:uncharacterized surface protein with fasciclin (FAS1) repeats